MFDDYDSELNNAGNWHVKNYDRLKNLQRRLANQSQKIKGLEASNEQLAKSITAIATKKK